MSEWYHDHAKKTTSNDLVGIVLVLTSTPPKPTSFSGMYVIEVKQKADPFEKFAVMLPDTDIGKAVELYTMKGSFTFKRLKKDDKYASVVEVK